MTTNIFDIAEVSISYKTGRITADRNKINSSQCAYSIAKQAAADHIEHYECFYIMMLNNANQVLGVSKLSQGGITGTLVDIRLIFQHLLKANATSLILFHNHPSGTLRPSEPDKKLTAKIKDACAFFDIKLLDHLIITEESYFSFADDGIL
ncbi:JAB domain-containing protein [Salegentibacter sp. BDJ18]|uniref:JAB domain-containing protein n=1 Tax=Salegentibacter sp. BDJ18 TaxID=2816376 RepID=UPI001AAEAD3D|nr:JAB domain-containing protein [Salegentibacter sp. BDJ18]MBO2546111.1 JAB domain-containing protein [Salegentibacter sp. BDJ18]